MLYLLSLVSRFKKNGTCAIMFKMFTSEIFAKMFSSVFENTHGKKKLVARLSV